MHTRKSPVHNPIVERHRDPIIIFLTVCTKDRKHILNRPEAHLLLRGAWQSAEGWLVGRYVIMPEHVHIFCAPASDDLPELAKWVKCWKALVSLNWAVRNEQPIWQRSFWDTQLRRTDSYADRWDYVARNPVRKGLCTTPQGWPYQGELNVLQW